MEWNTIITATHSMKGPDHLSGRPEDDECSSIQKTLYIDCEY